MGSNAKIPRSRESELCRSRFALRFTLHYKEPHHMHGLNGLVADWVMPQHTGTETLAIMLRWVHFLAGITWVGLLYFFNLVNVPFMKQVDAAAKPKIFQHLTLPALQWFRWSALLTVFIGLWYWAEVY